MAFLHAIHAKLNAKNQDNRKLVKDFNSVNVKSHLYLSGRDLEIFNVIFYKCSLVSKLFGLHNLPDYRMIDKTECKLKLL